jgi:serine/threonine protein phosphatase PrpC
MGSFLEKPLTDKDTHRGEGNGLRWASSAMQGWRVNMEDADIAVNKVSKFDQLNFFGVLDGHGGDLTSKYCGEHLVETIVEQEPFQKVTNALESNLLKEAMSLAHFKMDEKLKRLPAMSQGDTSGSTGITGFVTPKEIIVANCGDSRSVLCRQGGTAEEMSWDHKPTNPQETKRIEESGGHVSMKRVNGDLAVSRSFGDFVYKQAHDLPPQKQAVSVEPDIKITDRRAGDEFLIFACDGIWDVMSNQQCCDYIRGQMADGEHDIGAICESLIMQCLDLGSKDNMSVVLVVFADAKFGPKREKKAVVVDEKMDDQYD